MGKKPLKTTDNREIINFFQEMLTIRRFEEKAGQLYGMGQIGGLISCGAQDGQEGGG